ncbi:MAG: hypothetical protein M1821_005031 [Bathelium mastoideum]|nr:MAG: hypothetical protein M1821_005031 [Bathelium mastoideum]
MFSEESSFDEEWLQGFDTLTASLSPTSNMAVDDASSYFYSAPRESSPDSTQTRIEQLAKLVITIGRSVGTLSSPTSRSPLSTSSPPFNNICASASSLIMIIAQASKPGSREGELDRTMLELDVHMNPVPAFDYLPSHTPMDESVGLQALLDPGTLMMILACYQRLLEAFETICLFMQQRLQEMEMNSLIGFSEQRYLPLSPSFAQRSRSISPPSLSPPSDTLQFIMMIKLMGDLLNRLDRALAPLVGIVDQETSDGLSVGRHARHNISSAPSSSSSSSLSSSSSPSSSTRRLSSEDLSDRTPTAMIGEVATESDKTMREVVEAENTSNILIMKAGEQLRLQQSRLRALIKVVKRLVGSQKV